VSADDVAESPQDDDRRHRMTPDLQDRVSFTDVELVDGGGYTIQCRINGTLVTLPALFMLPGTTVWSRGDRGTLVMPRQVAAELGLA